MLRNIATRLPTSYRSSSSTNGQGHRLLASAAAAPTPPPPTQSNRQSIDHQNSPSPPIADSFAHLRRHSATDGFVWRSHYGQIAVPDMTLDEYVWKNVAKWQNKIAIVCGITGRKYTYARLRDHAAATARRLRSDYALQRGDVVAICMPNVPEYAIALLGALEAGLTVTTVNPAYTAAEQAKQLKAAKPRLVFGLVENVEDIGAAMAEWKVKVPVVAVRTHRRQVVPDGVRDLAEMMEFKNIDLSKPFDALHRPTDVCLLPFSSGTTGTPKGVQLTHQNVAANCEQMDMPLPERRMMVPTTNDFQDVIPCVLPFFHTYGLSFLLLSKLALGCKLVTLPRFDAGALVTMLAEHKTTFLPLVPPLMMFLARDERVSGERHLSSVRQVMCGAAASSSGDMEQLRKKSPAMHFMQGYGMTETSPCSMLSTLPCSNYDSIGRPVASTEAKIISLDDLTGTMGLDAGQRGELLVRGAQVMRGYLDQPEATSEAITSDGWLRTGDVAEYDANGEFYVRDRVKEVMKVNGFQVAPAELEEVLRSHPLVLDAAVIGVPDERSGERPRAFVRVRDRSCAAEELEKYVADRVAAFKRLSGGVQLVAEVPRNSTGKILRRELKRLYL